MLFSKRLTLAPPLAMRLEATIQGQGPSFQAELIPVRSPLLRESYLVPFPPLTYMLKFSGFAGLTSCYAGVKKELSSQREQRASRKTFHKLLKPEEAVPLNVPLLPSLEPRHTTTQALARAGACMRIPQALKQAYSQGYPESVMHVQISIGSRNSAIHNDYHTSLRPSSVLEPRYPSLKVVISHMSLSSYNQADLQNSSRDSGSRNKPGPLKSAGVHCRPRAPSWGK